MPQTWFATDSQLKTTLVPDAGLDMAKKLIAIIEKAGIASGPGDAFYLITPQAMRPPPPPRGGLSE